MAGDWIKFRKKLIRDGRVISAARKCNASRVTVVGALVTLWCVADDHCEKNGALRGYTKDDLEHELGVVGILDVLPPDWFRLMEDGTPQLPNYQQHNGETAKRRAVTANRVSAHRKRNAPSVTREEKRREDISIDSPNGESCSKPLRAASEPPVLSFGTVGKKAMAWHLTQQHLEELAAAFPGIDAMAEARKAHAWCEANPEKRKTSRGMPAFLFRWMEKAQNQGGTHVGTRGHESRSPARVRSGERIPDRHWRPPPAAVAGAGDPAAAEDLPLLAGGRPRAAGDVQ